jgi:hypothetical protein
VVIRHAGKICRHLGQLWDSPHLSSVMPLTRTPVTAPHHGPLKLGSPKPIASGSQAKPSGICRNVFKLCVATIVAPPAPRRWIRITRSRAPGEA